MDGEKLRIQGLYILDHLMKESRGKSMFILMLFSTENATLKQTLNDACPTAQRLASCVRELTATLQSHPFDTMT